MPIRTHCGHCKAVFQAKDSLAGKKVKCPKCGEPVLIGGSAATAVKITPGQKAVGATTANNPLLGLLDEADVKTAVAGPLCPNCSAEMKKGGVICISCGYNIETGKKLKTSIYVEEEEGLLDPGMSDADKIMAKAEKDIDDMPVSAAGQDFGDGSDSFLIAGVAGIVLAILVVIGLAIVFTMEAITKVIAPHFISFLASIVLAVCMILWITIVAFKQKSPHAIACILTAGLWCIVYGFMQGRQLMVPTIVLLACTIIGIASGLGSYFLGIYPNPGGN
jgi:predicted Zn finger-like uncharacterized protein